MCHSPSHFIAYFVLSKGCAALKTSKRVPLGQLDLRQRLVHLEDGVDRALDDARDVAEHVGHRLEVLVVEARRLDRPADHRQLAE